MVASSPELALRYVRELSADVRAGIVLDGRGERLAGPEGLAPSAAAVVAALAPGEEAQALRPGGAVFAVRGEGVSLVVACGPEALPGLARTDLRLALADLGGGVPGAAAAPSAVLAAAADAVLSAAQRGSPAP